MRVTEIRGILSTTAEKLSTIGVKTAEQARVIGAAADGVVVGTAIVNAIASVLGPKGEKTADPAEAVATLVNGLAQGVRSARLASAR